MFSGTIYAEPIRITMYINGAIFCTNQHYLNPNACQDILVLSKYPHVLETSYCGTMTDISGNTVGVIHVFVRLSKLTDVTEIQVMLKNGLIEYKSLRNKIITLPELPE